MKNFDVPTTSSVPGLTASHDSERLESNRAGPHVPGSGAVEPGGHGVAASGRRASSPPGFRTGRMPTTASRPRPLRPPRRRALRTPGRALRVARFTWSSLFETRRVYHRVGTDACYDRPRCSTRRSSRRTTCAGSTRRARRGGRAARSAAPTSSSSSRGGSPSGATCASPRRRWRAAAIEGAADAGADVLDLGLVGTEMVYFAVGELGLDGGIMVTASHNPKEYTGMKIVRRGALPVGGESGPARRARPRARRRPGAAARARARSRARTSGPRSSSACSPSSTSTRSARCGS